MRIDKLETENKTDCWDILYWNIIETATLSYGKSISPAIRNAIRLYARNIAEIELKIWKGKDLPNNLETFYKYRSLHMKDPRYRFINEKINTEEALFEVVVCPHYINFRKAGYIELLQPFCEEYTREFINKITNSKGQCNLSEILVQDFSSSCLFSCYFRQLNNDKYTKMKSQTFTEDTYFGTDTNSQSELKTYLFVEACFSEFSKQLHEESVLFILSNGLRNAAIETLQYLQKRANSTSRVFNKEYLKSNCGYDLGIAQSEFERPMNQTLLELFAKKYIEQLNTL